MNQYILDEINANDRLRYEQQILWDNKRKQHLHLLIAQILGFIAGIVVVILAYMSSSELSVAETLPLLLIFPIAFLMIFRLATRMFQILRIKVGRHIYSVDTGETYVVPRNVLAAFLAYIITGSAVGVSASILGSATEIALEGNVIDKIAGVAMGITFLGLMAVVAVYFFYGDLDYVRTQGAGTPRSEFKRVCCALMKYFAAITAILFLILIVSAIIQER